MERFQVVILVYVVDLVVLGSIKDGVKLVKDKLGSLLKLTDLREMCYYLGVAFEEQGNIMGFHRAAYCRRVLEHFWVERAKSTPTPEVDNTDKLFKAAVTREVGKTAVRYSHTGSC